MSQNKLTTFVQNNLVATIIAALVVGGGLSTLAFTAYNSGVKSIQSTISSSSSSASSSFQSKSSSSLSSSTTSSSSSEEVKKEVAKEPVKETQKTVEVEKPKVVEAVKNTPSKESDVYVNGEIYNYGAYFGTFYNSENYYPVITTYPDSVNGFGADSYSLPEDFKYPENFLDFQQFRITGKAKFGSYNSKDKKFANYILDQNVKIEPQINSIIDRSFTPRTDTNNGQDNSTVRTGDQNITYAFQANGPITGTRKFINEYVGLPVYGYGENGFEFYEFLTNDLKYLQVPSWMMNNVPICTMHQYNCDLTRYTITSDSNEIDIGIGLKKYQAVDNSNFQITASTIRF
jgi:hypothetical protein